MSLDQRLFSRHARGIQRCRLPIEGADQRGKQEPNVNSSSRKASISLSYSETDLAKDDALLHWGERLPDDLINTFCDRISDSTKSIEGLLAIQSIMLELERRPEQISGQKPVLQIILDQSQSHFVLLEWDPENRRVHLYDPFMPDCRRTQSIEDRVTQHIRKQIVSLFGHLSRETSGIDGNNNSSDSIRLIVERGIQLQEDDWSCGLRAISYLLLRLFGRNVEDLDIDLRNVLDFFLQILNTGHQPTLEDFREADFTRQRKMARKNRAAVFLLVKDTLKIKELQMRRRRA